MAAVLGVTLVTSATQPSSPTLYGYPVVWMPDSSSLTPVPVTPTAPAFNYTTFAVTTPSLSGVEYQYQDPNTLDWIPLAINATTSVSGFTRPVVIRVRAIALPGYVLTATYVWSALFYEASALVLAGSESFNRTAGTIINGTQGAAGLQMNQAGGGAESPAPYFWQWHAVPANQFGILTGGAQAGRYPAASGNSALWFVAPTNWAIEVDIDLWVRNHSRSWSVYVGPPASDIYGSNQPTVSINTPSGNSQTVNFSPATGMTGTTTFTHIGSGSLTADSQLYGTYRVVWLNKYLQIVMPSGTVYGRDYSTMTYTATAWGFLRVAEADASVIGINNFRIYK